MFTWIRRRFLAPHPLRLTKTLARLERLSRDDSQQHPDAGEGGGESEDRNQLVARRYLPVA
jgi:hypothetical protein